MAIVTSGYRPKRARKKRRQPPITNRIVTPGPMKPRKGPVIRLGSETDVSLEAQSPPKRSAIVTPKRTRPSVFGPAPDLTQEELQRRSEAANALWRELVRRAKA